jgi:hypothetical protein
VIFPKLSFMIDKWPMFKKLNDWLEVLVPNFCHHHIKCYEVHMVMHQNDMKFIHSFNRFKTIHNTQININTLNNACLLEQMATKEHIYFTQTQQHLFIII